MHYMDNTLFTRWLHEKSGMKCNVMPRFMVQGFQDPPLCILVILLWTLHCFYFSFSFYSVFCEWDLHISSHSLTGHLTLNLTLFLLFYQLLNHPSHSPAGHPTLNLKIISLILYTQNILWDLHLPSNSSAVHPTLNLTLFLSSISSKSSMSETSTILLILLLVIIHEPYIVSIVYPLQVLNEWDLHHPSDPSIGHLTSNLILLLSFISSKSSMSETSTIFLILLLVIIRWTLYCFYLLSAPSLQWVRPPPSFWSFYWSSYVEPYIVSIFYQLQVFNEWDLHHPSDPSTGTPTSPASGFHLLLVLWLLQQVLIFMFSSKNYTLMFSNPLSVSWIT